MSGVPKPRDYSEIVHCPLCGEVTIRNREFSFWKCPICGCEIWPDESDDEETEEGRDKAIRQVYMEETSTRWLNTKKRSSNRRSKRFGNKKKIPPSLDWRYRI